MHNVNKCLLLSMICGWVANVHPENDDDDVSWSMHSKHANELFGCAACVDCCHFENVEKKMLCILKCIESESHI